MRVDEFVANGVEPSGTWTTLAQWRTDDTRLAALFDGSDNRQALKLLSYGLERLDGRQLWLGVPADAVPATRHRAALIDADVRVFEHVDSQVEEVPSSTPSEALAWYGDLGGVTEVPSAGAMYSDAPAWLLDLVDWLESRRVEPVRRSQYWSWHYRGRQILRVGRSRDRYRLVAGVAYSKPHADQPMPVEVEVAGDAGPTEKEARAIRAALDDAIERRRIGHDSGHREHLLQAAIGVAPSLLGLVRLHREHPAWRPSTADDGGRGFIDFVGVDVDGGLHIIETKIGPDAQLGLQGLDYWAWATAHSEDIAETLGVEPPTEPVRLHYVLGCSPKGLLHRAAVETIRLLGRQIPWRCHVIADWDTIAVPRRRLRPRAVEGIRPYTVPDDSVCAETSA